jgi:hypothetical protein
VERLERLLCYLSHGGTPFASMPQVVRARDGALCALWALLAARLLSIGKESWLCTCTGSQRAPPPRTTPSATRERR